MKKTALVTGASSGIGLEFAELFAAQGHNLLITARREDRLKDLKNKLEKEHDVSVIIFVADLASDNAPEDLYRFTKEQSISIDFLINNAGVGDYGFFKDSDWSRQQAMINLNIKALTYLTHLFLPDLIKKKRAYILNNASTAAFQPGPLMSVYYASKHYVLAFGEALANELKGTGVTVTTLCPGPTKSEFVEVANMQKSKLFDRFPLPSSKEVAEYGFRSMMNGKVVAIHGISNKIFAKIVGVFPRKIVTKAVRKIQERK